MGRATRQREAVSAGVRTFLREPTNVVLLVVLPPLVLFMYDLALGPITEAPGIEFVPGGAELGGALFATAFLSGLLGVFQVVGTVDSDRRLVVCGYHSVGVLLARFLTILLAGGLVAGITFVTFLLRSNITPERPALAFGVLVSAAVIYGLLGICLGALVGRELEGSLVLVFLADIDSFGAIGAVPTENDVLEYFPLATPHDMLDATVYEGTVSGGDAVTVAVYILVLGLFAIGAVLIGGDSI
ncbi:ABC transporter permease [Halovenus rubra]|uniref:ABC transporter permease n=2 Tax=Halovenus rubra TaxID=869890 RepID=A0ABD5XCG7_9EURY|nr:ABC transporter permease [Halovenus rubra]